MYVYIFCDSVDLQIFFFFWALYKDIIKVSNLLNIIVSLIHLNIRLSYTIDVHTSDMPEAS